MDGLFENLMITQDGTWVMDYEWVFDFPVPFGYLKYRILYYFYERFKSSFGWQDIYAFFDLFGMNEDLCKQYGAMEENFQTFVHGDSSQGYLRRYQQPVETLDTLLSKEIVLEDLQDKHKGLNIKYAMLEETLETKEVEITKRNEVQRLSNNHIANLEGMIKQLRHDIDEMRTLIAYLEKHESVINRTKRGIMDKIRSRFPKGSKKRKILDYGINTIKHPVRYGKLYLTEMGRNRIAGDFAIGNDYLEKGKLIFPALGDAQPMVSIIIPVYNQIHYTYACLESILEFTKDVTYEVIIADDVSTDATKDLGLYSENLVISRNSENQGFLRNCNQAAAKAKGRYLMFLNNDTKVTEGWLSSLVSLLASDPSIGMVGSTLVYPDGRLQEAGGIIWSDGSGWNYGRLDDPDKAEYK